MNKEICIAIINPDPINPEIGIIKLTSNWLHDKLPYWLIENGYYDYFYQIADEEDELIEHFLFTYCGYSQNELHWHQVPAATPFKRLTIRDFQK